MSESLLHYWLPALLMGVGIGIDVSVATLARFRDPNMGWQNWTLPLTVTHIVFPAIGYYLFWVLSGSAVWLSVMLSAIGAALVILFVFESIMEWCDRESAVSLSAAIETGFDRLNFSLPVYWLAILAVSWDALWSGPAKAATASANAWTPMEVGVSFLIAGVVVAMMSQCSLWGAFELRRRLLSKQSKSEALTKSEVLNFVQNHSQRDLDGSKRYTKKLAASSLGAKFLEVSVIGGFGVNSIWYGLSLLNLGVPPSNLYWSIAMSACVLLCVFLMLIKALWRTELQQHQENSER